MSLILLILSIFLLNVSQITAKGGCGELRLCCPGRDSSCAAAQSKSSPINSIIEDLSEKQCYCDGACITLGDCCDDYKQTCGVIDCEVTQWENWSECDAECGLGTMSRTRQVTRQPQNGGQECPELHQKRGCTGQKCETRTHDKTSKETALILQSRFSDTRQVDESIDIRSNLRLRYPKDPQKENSHEYCVMFEIVKSRKSCDSLGPELSRKLVEGSQVCVQCQDAAMRKHLDYRCHGHGVEGKITRWTALAGHACHGRWIRREKFTVCPCHSTGHPDFIFV